MSEAEGKWRGSMLDLITSSCEPFLLGDLLVGEASSAPGSSVTCRITLLTSFVLDALTPNSNTSPDKAFVRIR